MANAGRMTTGSMPRLLQLGVDKELDHFNMVYEGPGKDIFEVRKTEKAFYEIVQLAGAGLAALKGEGAPVQQDSIDQDWVAQFPILAYAKGARFTYESLQDNLYMDLIPIMAKQIMKGLNATRDTLQANVFNNLFTTVAPDGKDYAATDHPLQAGGTVSNLISPALSFSEDAIEQMVILADNMKNPDGLHSILEVNNLIVPTALRFDVERLVNSRYRVDSADNTISAIYSQNIIKKVIRWKRLSSSTAFFLQTDAENGFIEARRQGIITKSFEEPNTYDVIVSAMERYLQFIADFRAVIANAGA